MTIEGVQPSLSPSMDIQVSSNFERLLFEVSDRDGAAVKRMMDQFKQSASYTVAPAAHARITALFGGRRLDDEGTKQVMRDVRATTGELVDPHTAVGIYAARSAGLDPAIPRIALATAHPAKFPDAVKAATGVSSPLPAAMADIFNRTERFQVLDNDLDAVKRLIRSHV